MPVVERWSPEKVVEFIRECRRLGGTPMFRARVGGVPLRTVEEGNVALAVCWGTGGLKAVKSVLFTHIPEEDYRVILEERGEWRILLGKYGGPEATLYR
ncbi:MAG: hypothetical protein LM580_12590 [Thermofilum sp.]|nr:hypothetical protein [Thermofilum sp.]